MRVAITHFWVCLVVVSLPILGTNLAVAQNANTGEIRGTVQDSSGALIEGVKVTIANVDTGVNTVSTTNSAGLYDAPSVPTGSYTVTFSKTGFKDLVRKGIKLQIQTIGVDATLQVGNATERVEVTAETPLVESESSDQHVNLSAEAVHAAPIVGTDWRGELTQLIPGVNAGGGTGEAAGQQVGVNGTQSYNVNFLVDGSAATAPRDYNSSNYYMPLDAISEVSVNSGNAPAEYGNGLTSVNVITKSGTNQWHGSAYEFIQNTAFNARGFYNQTGTKAVEHWNTYGGSLGGPVIKNKLFFFFNYQRNPASTPSGGLYSYPTAAMQAGNFFGMAGSTGPAFNSAGTLQGTNDPVAVKMQSYFPGANAKGWIPGCPGPVNPSASTPQTCPAINNYVFNTSSPNTDTWYTGKADYNLSSKQRLSFSFNYFPTVSSYVPPDPLYPNDATAFEQGHTDNLTAQLSHLFTISSTVVNEFRVGASRELDKYKPPSLGKNDPSTLGLQPTYGTNAPANVFPHVTIDLGTGSGAMALGAGEYGKSLPGPAGNGNIDATLGEGVYNVGDILTLIHGKHTIKVGGEYDKYYQNYTSWGDITSGHFEFNGGVTGIPYADFLAGDVFGWYVFEANPTSAHMRGGALFASDDFKVTPHLTLNLGLRWQAVSGWTVSNNLFGNYDPVLPNSADGGKYNGAILFGGQSDKAFGGSIGNLSAIQNGDYKEFAPRVGVAWSPRNNWSLRASYGMFDAPRDAENYTDGALGLGLNPHNAGNGGYSNGSSPWQLALGPPAGTVIFPTIQTLSPELQNFNTAQYYPRNMPTVYVSQFLFSVQHELLRGLLLDASYVNTRGRNLNFATDTNQAPANMLGCSGYNCGNPNPVFNAIMSQNYTGWSNYNALQLRLQKRMSSGLTFQVNYAWSKSLDTGTGNGHGSGVDVYQDAYHPGANYGLSDFNSANTLVGQVVYELPFGRGRQFSLHGPLNQIAGGWRLSSIFQWHGGVPFTPVIQSSVADSINGINGGGMGPSIDHGGATLYPTQVGDPRASQHSVVSISPQQHSGIGGWFNPAAFANPATGTFGNTRRNSLIGPGYSNVDLSLGKEFSIVEKLKLEVRADAYNAFNHVNYGNPDANVGYGSGGALSDGTAGTITGPAGFNSNMRIMQLGARLIF
jgi:outer membrane receptor protein involved in Fe transport